MSTSLAAPAVRMVIVEAWAAVVDGMVEVGHDYHEVLAIRSTVAHLYVTGRDEAEIGPTPEAMIRLGWRYDGSEVAEDLLIYSDQYAGVVPVSVACESSNGSYRVVVAPWPRELDRERLASVVQVVREEALTRAAAWTGKGVGR